MKDQKLTNPAKRLHYFLTKAREIKATERADLAFAALLDADQENHVDLLNKISGFLHLIEDTDIRIKSLDDPNRENFLRCMEPIRTAFTITNLQQQWQNHINKYSILPQIWHYSK